MAREQGAPSAANLIHHYTHVVVALNESRKGSNCAEETAAAIDKTLKGVCELVDVLVSMEHKDAVAATSRGNS